MNFSLLNNNFSLYSESSRRKLVNKKVAELNLNTKTKKDTGIPAAQGTEVFVNNPEIMKEDLLTQEDGGTECSKYAIFILTLLKSFLCEAYEVGWDFTFPP